MLVFINAIYNNISLKKKNPGHMLSESGCVDKKRMLGLPKIEITQTLQYSAFFCIYSSEAPTHAYLEE